MSKLVEPHGGNGLKALLAPQTERAEELERARAFWQSLPSDPDADFDQTLTIDVSSLAPQVTWGTNPGMVMGPLKYAAYW